MPPRPINPMMRYRSTNTIPGVNPPMGKESDEISLPTGAAMGAAATAGADGESIAAVGACESELTGAPQEGQNL